MKYNRKTVEKRKHQLINLGFLAIGVIAGAFLNMISNSIEAHNTYIQENIDTLHITEMVSPEGNIPLEVEAIQASYTPPKQDVGYRALIHAIGTLESGNGKAGHAKTCREQNKINDWGYFPNGDHSFCFEDYDGGQYTIYLWLEKHLEREGMSIPQALCHYNQGTVTDDCEYYQNYLIIK